MKKNLLRGIFATLALCFASVASAATVITVSQFADYVGQEVQVNNVATQMDPGTTFAANTEYDFYEAAGTYPDFKAKPSAALVGQSTPDYSSGKFTLIGTVQESSESTYCLEIASISYSPTVQAGTMAAPSEVYVGQSVKVMFYVIGKHLTGDLTISGESTDTEATFEFAHPTVTKAQAEGINGEFESSVTITPKTVSENALYTVNIHLNGELIESFDIRLKVLDTAPSITFPDYSNPWGTIYVGDTVTATVQVKGNEYVNDTVFLHIPEGSDIIEISPDTLLPSAVKTEWGAEVTITLVPSAAGSYLSYPITATTKGQAEPAEYEGVYINKVLAADPSVSFSGAGTINDVYAGVQCSKTVTLTANKFVKDSVFLSSAHAAVDSIVPAAFSAEEAKAGAKFTAYLTFDEPNSTREYVVIEANSKDMVAKTCSVSAVVADVVPEITVKAPSYIWQTAKVGVPFVQTFTVKGNPYVTKDVKIEAKSEGIKSISPATIAAADLVAGTTTVTVEFLPKTASPLDAWGDPENQLFEVAVISEEIADTLIAAFQFGVGPAPELILEPAGDNVGEGGVITTYVSRPTTVTLNAKGANLDGTIDFYITATGGEAVTLSEDTITVASYEIEAEGGHDFSFDFIPAIDGTYTIKIVAESEDFPATVDEIGATHYQFETQIAVLVKPNPDFVIEATGYNVESGVVSTYGAGRTDIQLHATGANLEDDVELVLAVSGGLGTSTITPDTVILSAADLTAEGGYDFSVSLDADTIGFYTISLIAEAIGFENSIYVQVKAIPDLVIEATGHNVESGVVSTYGAGRTDIQLHAASTNIEDDVELVLAVSGGLGTSTITPDTIILSAADLTAEGGYDFSVSLDADTIGFYTISLTSEAIDFSNSIYVQVKAIPELIIEATGYNVESGVVSTYGAGRTDIQLHATGANLEDDVELVLAVSGGLGTSTITPDTIILSAADLTAEGGYDFSISLDADTIGFYTISLKSEAIDFENNVYVQVKAIPGLIIEAVGPNTEAGTVYAYTNIPVGVKLHATGENLTEDLKLYISASGTGETVLSEDTILVSADALQAEGGCDVEFTFSASAAGFYQIKVVAESADFPIVVEEYEGETFKTPSFETSVFALVTDAPGLIIEAVGPNTEAGTIYAYTNIPVGVKLHATGENLTEDLKLYISASGTGETVLSEDTILVSADALQAEGGYDINFTFTADEAGFYTINVVAESADFPIHVEEIEGIEVSTPSFETQIYALVTDAPGLIIEAVGEGVEYGTVYTHTGTETSITLHAIGENLTEDLNLYLAAGGSSESMLSVDTILVSADELQAEGGCDIKFTFTASAAGFYQIKVVAESADFPIVVEEYEGETFKTPSFETTIYVMVEDDTTGLENVEAQNRAIKVLENGQVYIIKNGVKYNILGVVVER